MKEYIKSIVWQVLDSFRKQQMIGEVYTLRISFHGSVSPFRYWHKICQADILDKSGSETKIRNIGWVANEYIFYYDSVYDGLRGKIKKNKGE